MRLRSFSVAARELNLSQPAVSRHISTLEARLGQRLFHRNNNRITPTDNAQRLADAVALGFGHVHEAWESVLAPPERDEVVLACSFGFADQWLMPRFSELRNAMRGTRVRVVTTDQLGDIDMSKIDAAVTWDLNQHPQRPFLPLIPDETFPVCSPEFAARRGLETGAGIEALPVEDFLNFDVGRSGFLTWNAWFAHAGLPPGPLDVSPEFDAYPFLMQAVLNHEGIALGWRGLVDKLLQEGRIIRAGPSVSQRETAYYLQYRPIRNEDDPLSRLLAWFEAQVDRDLSAVLF